MHWETVYSRTLHFQFPWFSDLRYISVSIIKKSSTLENKIRNQFTVRSWHNILQQNANATNEWMIP